MIFNKIFGFSGKNYFKQGLVRKSVRDEIVLYDDVKTNHIKNDSNMTPKIATSTTHNFYGYVLGTLKLGSFNVHPGVSKS